MKLGKEKLLKESHILNIETNTVGYIEINALGVVFRPYHNYDKPR